MGLREHQMHGRLREVTSRGNAAIKELRRAFSHAEMTKDGLVAIEGVRMIEEAIRSGLRFHTVFFRQSSQNLSERLLPQLSSHVAALLVPNEVFAGAVATEAPQGVAALVEAPRSDLGKVLTAENAVLIAAAGLQDPGNLGTLIRSAEAFGASGALLLEGTVSACNPKTIRAAAGSLFRLPVVTAKFSELVPQLRERKIRLLATSSRKGRSLERIDLTGAVCILIGNEGTGLPRQFLSEADESIMIPHSTKVESLNAGVAAAVILYEAARQRREQHGTV
jgi:TrmH family RNA methyltransferase